MGKPAYPTVTQPSPSEKSDWIAPVMRGYRMQCCDCGLVHEIDFDVVVSDGVASGPEWSHGEPLDPKRFRVLIRGRRLNRNTAQVRRHRKIKIRQMQ